MAAKRIYHPSAADPSQPVLSHWRKTAITSQNDFAPLSNNAVTDVAIVGGGVTGLNAALQLSQAHGRQATVLDMGDIGFGASGRNGGFVCTPATLAGWTELARRFGVDETRTFYRAQCAAISHVDDLIDRYQMRDVRQGGRGELALAHSRAAFEALRNEAEQTRTILGEGPDLIPADALAEFGAAGPQFYGGALHAHGFAIHPMNYVKQLADAAVARGAMVHGQTEVLALEPAALRRYRLITPTGTIEADDVIFAMNGYTDETLFPWLRGRLMPALSNVLVTAPIPNGLWREQGFTTDIMAFDTRTLLHYFRRLPDGRMLIGGRGGVRATRDAIAKFQHRLRADFDAMFPRFAGVPTETRWSGFVALSRKGLPFIGAVPGCPGAWAAMAYHGNGVATGSWAGARIADLVAGARPESVLPAILRQRMPRFPLPGLRPVYLRAAYALYERER